MGPKLLFFVGIVVAHSAIAAVLVKEEMPHQRTVAGSCAPTPDTALPDYSPRLELYASNFMRVGSITEEWQP